MLEERRRPRSEWLPSEDATIADDRNGGGGGDRLELVRAALKLQTHARCCHLLRTASRLGQFLNIIASWSGAKLFLGLFPISVLAILRVL
jgi:hypothetical protein